MAPSKLVDVVSSINILVYDDQPFWRDTTRVNCEMIFEEIKTAAPASVAPTVRYFECDSPERACEILSENLIHILFLDKDLGLSLDGKKINGVDLIQRFKAIQPFCQIIMLTADQSPIDIARAIRNGATDYLLKSSGEEYKEYRHEVIKRALEFYTNEVERAKEDSNQEQETYIKYVCSSPAMQRFDNKLHALSESSRSALLLGQTGLGKGAAARRINELSRIHFGQEKRPFIQLNIGSTEKSMLESILFGTEPGAFTGAHGKTKAGLLDVARNGDMFLDEIGDSPSDLQLKLLKVIEEKEFYRVGGNQPVKTNARFIFATNRDLQSMIEKGTFREDLYMRISTFEETVPSLAERKSDLPDIIREFLAKALLEYPKKRIRYEDFPEDLVRHLTRENITGNIRGIESEVFRVVAHSPVDEIGKPDFKHWRRVLGFGGSSNSGTDGVLTYKKLISSKFDLNEKTFPGLWELTQAIERKIFEDVKSQGITANEAARILKISRNTVLTRMKEFGLSAREVNQ